jgi:hypothetical protein
MGVVRFAKASVRFETCMSISYNNRNNFEAVLSRLCLLCGFEYTDASTAAVLANGKSCSQ